MQNFPQKEIKYAHISFRVLTIFKELSSVIFTFFILHYNIMFNTDDKDNDNWTTCKQGTCYLRSCVGDRCNKEKNASL